MVRQERVAWMSLSVLGLALVSFTVLCFLISVPRATGAFGLLGLLGLTPLLFRKSERDPIVFDERDRLIQARSIQIAYAVFWLLFVVGSMSLYFFYQQRGLMPVEILPMFPLVGWMIVTFVQSIAVLVQYRRDR